MKLKRRYKLTFWILFIVIINVTVYFYDYRTELTEHNSYKLDSASVGILKKIDEPIIITFYKSDNLNPLQERFADNILQILQTYQETSETPIHLEIVNPYESLEVELEATNAGIKPMEIKGQDNTLSKIFLGIILQVGNRTEVLPQITPRMSVEYLVSSSLRKITEMGRRQIALIQGHGEPTSQNILGVEKRLRPNYILREETLSSSNRLMNYESLLIIAPSLKYSDSDLDKLDAFLNAGKNIFIALDRVEYDTEDEEVYKIDTRLEEWLVRKGLIVHGNFIVDNACSDVKIEKFAPAIAFPYFPQITNFPKHIATGGIGIVVLRYASSIEFTNKIGVSFSPLAKTSEVSGKKELPLRIDLKHEWKKTDYLFPEQVVAALIEGKLGPNTEKQSKIVVISDADFALGDDGLQELDNHLFIANIIDWLSDVTGLAELKQKGVSSEQRESHIEVSAWKKYANIFLPLLVVGLVGLLFYFRRKWHIDKLRTADF